MVRWRGGITKRDAMRLDKLVRHFRSVVGMEMDSLVMAAKRRHCENRCPTWRTTVTHAGRTHRATQQKDLWNPLTSALPNECREKLKTGPRTSSLSFSSISLPTLDLLTMHLKSLYLLVLQNLFVLLNNLSSASTISVCTGLCKVNFKSLVYYVSEQCS